MALLTHRGEAADSEGRPCQEKRPSPEGPLSGLPDSLSP